VAEGVVGVCSHRDGHSAWALLPAVSRIPITFRVSPARTLSLSFSPSWWLPWCFATACPSSAPGRFLSPWVVADQTR
jgi:hypothetical protein